MRVCLYPWPLPPRGRACASAETRRNRARAAFTLIELLVVIAIVAMLISLLLPAIHAARQASLRAACASNLRQIGVGLHNYHNTYRTFPPGGIEFRSLAKPAGRQIAWSALLLPFVDEQAVFAMLDLRTAFDSPENAAGAAVVLPLYLCPAALRSSMRVEGRGACDYGGVYGERLGWPGRPPAQRPNNPPKGPMIYDRAFSIRKITDGTSRTLIVGEDTEWLDGQWINGRNIFDQAFAINAAPAIENDIRSVHPGGANVLVADGAVRFLPEDLSLPVLAAICTRAKGEAVPEF